MLYQNGRFLTGGPEGWVHETWKPATGEYLVENIDLVTELVFGGYVPYTNPPPNTPDYVPRIEYDSKHQLYRFLRNHRIRVSVIEEIIKKVNWCVFIGYDSQGNCRGTTYQKCEFDTREYYACLKNPRFIW